MLRNATVTPPSCSSGGKRSIIASIGIRSRCEPRDPVKELHGGHELVLESQSATCCASRPPITARVYTEKSATTRLVKNAAEPGRAMLSIAPAAEPAWRCRCRKGDCARRGDKADRALGGSSGEYPNRSIIPVDRHTAVSHRVQIPDQASLGKTINSLLELSIILVNYHRSQSNVLQESLRLLSIRPDEFEFLSRNGHCFALSRRCRFS
jgi:hypothetical protein